MKYVLFVCNHNAGRSQMAQAFFERMGPEDIWAESAGTDPAHAIWPNVIEAMAEVGIDISGRRPKRLDLETQLHADHAVTLNCGASCPFVPTTVENWDVPDPAGRPLAEVRAIRDGIEQRVRDLVEKRMDEIRSDRTAHEQRLEKLLPGLARQFAGQRTDEEIRACADAVLCGFEDAAIRSHILTLAHRKACDCLARDTCDLLTTA